MDVIRTLIVDDEKPARTRLTNCLGREPDVEIVGVARDGVEAVEQIRTLSPDLVFLDVQMPTLDGFAVVEKIGSDAMPLTIFVTAHDNHAIHAFETHAVDYLLKPFSDERFRSALFQARKCLALGSRSPQVPADPGEEVHRDAVEHRGKYVDRIALRTNGRILFLDVNDIDWIEAAGYTFTCMWGIKRISIARASSRFCNASIHDSSFACIGRQS